MSYTNSSSTNITETLLVGHYNPGNTLIVNNSSTLEAEKLVVGNGEYSINNLVSVEGDALLMVGESDTNGLATGGIVVGGVDDDSSALVVDHASKLEGEYLYVGFGTNDSGKVELSNNTDITDDLSELNIAQDAYVGHAGSTNSITINSKSIMRVGGMLTVGSASGSNNYVNINKDGILFVNS
ncbi:MAG: hypothetical protein ABFR47_04395, partial [Verrucomicrobiota bacterium]